MAARLSGLARAGEILVGPDAHLWAEGYFDFETPEPTEVKGKAETIQVYKVLSVKGRPDKVHRLCGVRAELIGRKAEFGQLQDAIHRLRKRQGAIISVCGDAGTGKSRLVTEFRDTLDLDEIQWVEGHAYAYSQNIPYFPLVDLLTRYLQIEEGDPAAKVKEKIETGIHELMGGPSDIVPYIGSLFSIKYPETENVGPEFWKVRVREAMQAVFSALAQGKLTVICLEDLHWADPSSLELIRSILPEFMYPALFLCIYRPTLSLFSSHQPGALGESPLEIQLQDLSASDALTMMESLLETRNVPSELRGFIQDKVEGNPFYLEEVVNSLIESERLIRDNDGWRLVGPISEAQVPSTIHGVISARLDRLDKDAKRILQEASVIGRAFFYEILEKVTEIKKSVEGCLSDLTRLDLIRTRALEPDLEYVFKHALAQEAIYNGVLKKEREVIHERIATVMEQVFQDRLSEFYETLAFHYKQGRSTHKAVEYLMKSGEKSQKRYAIEEAHQYYQEAYDILSAKSDKTKEDEDLLLDLFLDWGYVFYYRSDFKGGLELIEKENRLFSLDNKAKIGRYHAAKGFALFYRGRLREAYEYSCQGLKLAEESGDPQAICVACTTLAYPSAALGLLDDSIALGERAFEIAKELNSEQPWVDDFMYSASLSVIAYASLSLGDRKRIRAAVADLVDFGERHSDLRSMAWSYICRGYGHWLAGDFMTAVQSAQKAVQIPSDPVYPNIARIVSGSCYSLEGRFQEAETELRQVMIFGRDFGNELLGQWAHGFLGAALMGQGRLNEGLGIIKDAIQATKVNEANLLRGMFEYLLGKIYLQLIVRTEASLPVTPSLVAKNLGFMLRNLPFAGRRAEAHLNQAIALAREMGANWILGQACLDLGLLHKAKKRRSKTRECFSESVVLFEQCQAEAFLEQAREALASLE